VDLVDAVPLGRIDQTFSHIRIVYHVFQAAAVHEREADGQYRDSAWTTLEGLSDFALARAQRRITAMLR
jgi:adenine-specific DNA glycosylase